MRLKFLPNRFIQRICAPGKWQEWVESCHKRRALKPEAETR